MSASGTPLSTTFLGATRVRATIPADLLATQGTLQLTVDNPAPGGGPSGAVTFTVQAAATGGGGGGGTGGGGANCLYRCVDYNYAPGQCYQGWYCIPDGQYAGCLGQTTCF